MGLHRILGGKQGRNHRAVEVGGQFTLHVHNLAGEFHRFTRLEDGQIVMVNRLTVDGLDLSSIGRPCQSHGGIAEADETAGVIRRGRYSVFGKTQNIANAARLILAVGRERKLSDEITQQTIFADESQTCWADDCNSTAIGIQEDALTTRQDRVVKAGVLTSSGIQYR